MTYKKVELHTAERVGDEVLVLDPNGKAVHSLPADIYDAWEKLNEAQDRDAVIEQLSSLGEKADEAFVALVEAGLLAEQSAKKGVGRREVLLGAGKVAAAAALLSTVALPKPACAASNCECATPDNTNNSTGCQTGDSCIAYNTNTNECTRFNCAGAPAQPTCRNFVETSLAGFGFQYQGECT